MSELQHHFPWVLLGAGGAAPRVDALDENGTAATVLQLAPGDSVYVLIARKDGLCAVAGAKGGKIHELDLRVHPPAPTGRVFHQGAALTAGIFLENALIAADADGRILEWEEPFHTPSILRPEGSPVCSFLDTGECLIGLCLDGMLVIWPKSLRTPPAAVKGMAPPSPAALVQAAYLDSLNSAVFPAKGGGIQVYNPASQTLKRLAAHRGDFCAMTLYGAYLVSAGRCDGRLKLWRRDSLVQVGECPIPQGVIAAGASPARGGALVFATEDGGAVLFEEEEGAFVQAARLPHGEYRTVAGVHCGVVEASRQQREEMEARTLVAEAEESLESGRIQNVGDYACRLRERGYAHLALYVEARAAAHADDPIAEIAARRAMCGMLPDRRESCDSLLRLAALLWQFRQIDETIRILERAAAAGADDAIQPWLRHASECRAALARGKGLVMLEKPGALVSVLSLAARLGTPYPHPLLIRELPPIFCRGEHVSPDAFAAVCAGLDKEPLAAPLPACRLERVCIVDDSRIHPEGCAALFRAAPDNEASLEFGLRFTETEVETVAVPMLIFAPAALDGASTADECSQRALRRAQCITEQNAAHSWIRHVHRHAQRALAHLVSEIKGNRQWEGIA